jgi:hypothetical protein
MVNQNRRKRNCIWANPLNVNGKSGNIQLAQVQENIPIYYGMQEVGGSIPPGSTIYSIEDVRFIQLK